MKITFLVQWIPISLLVISSCKQSNPVILTDTQQTYINEVERNLPKWLEDYGVPGAALVVIENGHIIYQKGIGFANLESKEKVSNQTGFNIGSISKVFTAWGIMNLVEEGKIHLDDPAEKYLSRWKFPKSAFSSDDVTIRRLLSHTAGLSLHGYVGYQLGDELPSLEESLSGVTNGSGDVRIISQPGKTLKYSGGGYTVLQLVIEEVSGMNFSDYMEHQILDPLGMTNSGFILEDELLEHSSNEHNLFQESIPLEIFTAKAAAGMHTTINDFTKFILASLNNDSISLNTQSVLRPATIDSMVTPQLETNGNFGLGYGFDIVQESNDTFPAHAGGNFGWHAFFSIDRESYDGFAMLTNGDGGKYLHRKVYCDWLKRKLNISERKGCEAAQLIPELIKELKQSGLEAAINLYLKKEQYESDIYRFNHGLLNGFGITLIWDKRYKEAIEFLKLNIERYPESWIAYNSLARAYMKNGNGSLAIENYEKSIELNPNNENGRKMILKLKSAQ